MRTQTDHICRATARWLADWWLCYSFFFAYKYLCGGGFLDWNEPKKKAYLAEASPQARLSVFASIQKIHYFSIGVLLNGRRVWIDCFHGMSHGRYLLLRRFPYATLIGPEWIQKNSDHVVDSKVSLFPALSFHFCTFRTYKLGVAGVVQFFMAPYKGVGGFPRRMYCASCAIAAAKVIKLASECGMTNKCISSYTGFVIISATVFWCIYIRIKKNIFCTRLFQKIVTHWFVKTYRWKLFNFLWRCHFIPVSIKIQGKEKLELFG